MLRLLILALIGRLMPVTYSGRRYFRRALQQNGVDISKIPNPCLDELADQAIRQGKSIAALAGRNLQTSVVQAIDGQAVGVAIVLDPPADAASWFSADSRLRYASVLEKHGVTVPPLL